MKTRASDNRVRLQLDAAPALAKRLDEIVVESGAASRTEVVRRALALYDRALTAVANGGDIRIVQPGVPDCVIVIV